MENKNVNDVMQFTQKFKSFFMEIEYRRAAIADAEMLSWLDLYYKDEFPFAEHRGCVRCDTTASF